ncbi:hypothetical protein LCGC14_1042360 [marine sediment metagenome]|uniref:Uncharacterized protein n=1 Tax=marine sediment metagenome TaxID=412755 RepID=A0A0F9MRC5_9ZZZZ
MTTRQKLKQAYIDFMVRHKRLSALATRIRALSNILRGRPVMFRMHLTDGDAALNIAGTAQHALVAECDLACGPITINSTTLFRGR